MIHDIRVFNPNGELTNIINGQKLMDAKYEKIAKSIAKTVWGKHVKTYKTKPVTCPICKITVEGRANQVTCGSAKCIRERQQAKKYPKSLRKFKCPECGVKIETRHHNKKTCGLQECFVKNRNKGEKLRIKKLKEKKHGSKKITRRYKNTTRRDS